MPGAPPEAFGPAEFQAASNVSRETLARLKLYVGMLEDWTARTNLVSRQSLPDVWRRHVWDSAQLASLIPAQAKTLVDLGSGAGFPGLVLAAVAPLERVVLYESIAKKCRFLEAVATRLGLGVEIRNSRIEDAPPEPFDVLTARACAPLDQLLSYAARFQGKNTLCLFLKGQSVGEELSAAHKSWRMDVERLESRSDPSGTVLAIRNIRP